MAKHRKQGRRWWPPRRRADVAAQIEDQARLAAAEAPTDVFPVYVDHVAEAVTEEFPVVTNGELGWAVA